MKIGLTYDLRADYLAAGYSEEQVAEFDQPRTVEALEEAIATFGHDVVRIGRLHELVKRLAAGERWDLVFNIAEGLHGYGRESQVPALLDAYGIPSTFSDPLTLALSLHKGFAKRVVRDAGVPTPDFAVVERESDLAGIDLPFPLFIKPVAEGTSKGVTSASCCRTRQDLERGCVRLLAQCAQPVLVETFLPGREFTVGIVSGPDGVARAVGTMEVRLLPGADEGVYTYRNKERCEELVRYELADERSAREAEALALRAWKALGCRDAGRVDVRADASGRLQFIEVNPLPGLHPEHSDLPILCGLVGMTFRELIGLILQSALGRAGAGALAHGTAR